MKISKVKVRSVIGTSKISTFSHAINAYVGCPHACIYCYAKFMRRISGHSEEWGEFVDIKEFDENGIDKFLLGYTGQSVFMSSVTDCYNPVESKAKNTRKILEKLAGSEVKLQILTKSKLVLRDISLFKTMPNLRVGVSISTLDNDLARIIEPRASLPKDRLEALKILRENGIKTLLFISPIFPEITPVFEIVDAYSGIADEIGFEELNAYPDSKDLILAFIGRKFPKLLPLYKQIYLFGDTSYFRNLLDEINVKMNGKRFFVSFNHR